MTRPTLATVLVLVLALPAPQANADDAELAKGIRQVQEADYDAAILSLDAVARRLAGRPGAARDLSQAYLYLGIAYFGLGHVTSAKAKFQEAIARAGDLTLSPQDFSPKVIEAFEQARREPRSAGSPAPSAAAARPEKKGGGKTALVLLGVGGAAAAGVALAAGGGGGTSSSPSPSPSPSAPGTVTEPFGGLLNATQTAAEIPVGPVQNAGPWRAELNWTGANTEVRMFIISAANGNSVGDVRLLGPNSSILQWDGTPNTRYVVQLFLQDGGEPSSNYDLRVTHPR